MGNKKTNNFEELKQMRNKMASTQTMRTQLSQAKKKAQPGFFETAGSLGHCIESLTTCCKTAEYNFLAQAS